MSKKIVILEPSATLQKLFATTLDGDEYGIQFATDGKEAIYMLLESVPDLFLLNAELDNPGSYEVVRIVRTISCLKGLSVGMYATTPFPFDEELAQNCGADVFLLMDKNTMSMSVAELVQISGLRVDRLAVVQARKEIDDGVLFKNAVKILRSDSFRSMILTRIIQIFDIIESVEDVVREFLSIIVEVCEVPMAGLFIVEDDGPHGYCLHASNIGNREIDDFMGVCATDFEKIQPDYNVAKVQPLLFEPRPDLDRFYTKTVQLSSYESADLRTLDERSYFGTVHVVAEGNISFDKQDVFEFCVKNAGSLFDKVLIVKKKMFFERRIRRAFSRFVPEQIIDDLVLQVDNTDEKVGVGETRAVAILFSDIRSFTNISERNKPDVIVSFLNRYFSIMVDIIKKHGGTIDKFIGDAIMAEFGTPVSYEDNSSRAVAAACEMRSALASVDIGDLVLPEGMSFNIGIGIHYGDVIVGSIGSKDKTDYSVIGDNVNLASRLEGLTKTYGTQVLVSGSVFDDVLKSSGENAFAFRHLDDVRVKGKATAVPIYAVDRDENEFPAAYKDYYIKGMGLYKQGIWNLAKDYFDKALSAAPNDKAASLMRSRCAEFIASPPEKWDGAIAFMTK